MSIRTLATALVLGLTIAAAGRGAEMAQPIADTDAAKVQLPYAQLGLSAQPETQQPVMQPQYGQPMGPAGPELTYVPPYPPPPQQPCEVCGCPDGCVCDAAWCRSGWKLGFELYGLQSDLTDSAFGRWPNDGGGAAEVTLGYEWMSGFGIRANWWSFFEDASVPGPDVELSMGKFELDFYKAIVSGHGELVIGAGPAGGGVKFRIPRLNSRTEFRGGGATVFAEGYYPFVCRPLWELAFVGATRMTLLTGDWDANGGGIVDDTDGDSLSIWEISFGLEYRHRCGQLGNHYWFLQAMPEHQQWSSEWMADQLRSSIALNGVNFNIGFVW